MSTSELRGALVTLGLGSPTARGIAALSILGITLYASKLPYSAFDDEGAMKIWKPLSLKADEGCWCHFLVLPVVLSTAVFLVS